MGDRDLRIGATLAERYTLRAELGSGGMATVYRATDLKLGRDVAVKVIRDEISAALGAERFEKEIRLLSTLTHPNIVGLIDSGTVDGSLYYVMPLVEGETLRARLDREGRLPIEDALGLTAEVGHALGHAHGLGIVHRDIKPENIMLVGGSAVVTDFGIAKALNESADERLTSTGVAIGTVGYMSPEQSLGSMSIDHRSDQYSLATVLYEMLAGEPPFTGPNAQSIIARKNTEPPRPIRSVRETVSVELEAVVLRALARDPVDRYPTTEAFLEALASAPARSTSGEVSAARGAATVPVAGGWRRWGVVLTVLAVTAVGGVLAVWGGLGAGASGTETVAWSPTNRARIVFLKCRVDGTPDAVGSGILAAITSRLQSVRSVVPISSSATDRFADSSLGPEAIADSLAADYVAGCAVGEDEVEFTLADHRGRALWSDRFTAADLVGATTVLTLLDALGIEPDDEERTALGSYQSSSRVADSLLQLSYGYEAMANDSLNNLRLELLNRAVREDPGFGPAWAALSGVYSSRLRNLGQLHDPVESASTATRTAKAAVRLAPLIPESHLAMASVHLWVEFDFAAARESVNGALLLSRTSVGGLFRLAFLHAWVGQADSAMRAADQAVNVAMMDAYAMLTHGFIAYLTGDLETAISDYRWVNQFTGSLEDNGLQVWALIEAGRLDEAEAAIEEYCAAGLQGPCRYAPIYLAAARGDTAAVLEAVRSSRARNVPWRPNHAFEAAEFFAMAGMADSAFAALDEAARGPSPFLTRFRVDPHFKLLRADPRFEQLADRLGLPPLQG